MSKNQSTKHYQENKEKLRKKPRERSRQNLSKEQQDVKIFLKNNKMSKSF